MDTGKRYTFLLTPRGDVVPTSALLDQPVPGETTIEIQADAQWTITGQYRNQLLTAVSLRKHNRSPKV